MIRVLWALTRAVVACYYWSQTRPQAIGYGGILMFGALYGAGDAIMLMVAGACITGGLVGVWRYLLGDGQ